MCRGREGPGLSTPADYITPTFLFVEEGGGLAWLVRLLWATSRTHILAHCSPGSQACSHLTATCLPACRTALNLLMLDSTPTLAPGLPSTQQLRAIQVSLSPSPPTLRPPHHHLHHPWLNLHHSSSCSSSGACILSGSRAPAPTTHERAGQAVGCGVAHEPEKLPTPPRPALRPTLILQIHGNLGALLLETGRGSQALQELNTALQLVGAAGGGWRRTNVWGGETPGGGGLSG